MIKGFETVCLAAGNPGKNYNEDRIGHRKNVFWVIDGMTSLNSERIYPEYATDAEAFAVYLSEGLFQHCDKKMPLRQILGIALRYTVEKSDILKNGTVLAGCDMPSAGVVIIRVNEDVIEYLRLGDSEICYPSSDFFSECRAHKAIDANTLHKIHARMTGKNTNVFSLEFGLDLIKNARNKMNNPDGYWVATPRAEGLPFAETGSIPNRGNSIYLWSDGFGCLFENYGYSRDILQKKSISELSDIVRKIENNDPELKDHWRFKQHDDLSVIRVELG